MKQKTLTMSQILKQCKNKIKGHQVVLLRDTDGDLSMLYEKNNRIAFQFQDNWCPIVYPLMRYEIVGIVHVLFAIEKMKQRTLERVA